MSAITKNLTIDGVTKSVSQWAKDIGMAPTTLHGRLERGWTVEEAMKAPLAKVTVSKSDAEFALNDMTRHQLPSQLEKLIPPEYKGIKYGEYLRNHFRKDWDSWFTNIYAKQHERRQK